MTAPTTRSDWVTFLSDYGLDDHLVGVCKGVIARIAPHVRIIDVCHQVRPQDVTMGGEMLAEAWPYLPTGLHLALVDPFTATNNRGVAVLCRDGSVVVAPDNGLSSRAWQVAGGVAEAYELAEPRLWAETPSRSFRGLGGKAISVVAPRARCILRRCRDALASTPEKPTARCYPPANQGR